MFPVLYTTQVNSFATPKARHSAVCNLLIYFEFVLHIVDENWAFPSFRFAFIFLQYFPLFFALSQFLFHIIPIRNAILLGCYIYVYIHNDMLWNYM